MNNLLRENFIVISSLLIGTCLSAIITILMNRSVFGNHFYDIFYSIRIYFLITLNLSFLLIILHIIKK